MKKEAKNISVQKTANSTIFQKSGATHTQLYLNQFLLDEIAAQSAYVLNSDAQSILDIFQQVSTDLQFSLLQREAFHATAVRKKKKNPFTFLRCFNICSPDQMTAIKISLQDKGQPTKSICRLKGLVGSVHQINQFFSRFAQKTILIQSHQVAIFDQIEKQVKQEPSNPFEIQACAMFTFQRILAHQKSQAYRILSTEIQDLKNSLNKKESTDQLTMTMKHIIMMINQIHQILDEQYRSNKNYCKIMPYCRVSVERYVFDKVDSILTPIYKTRNQPRQQTYRQKKHLIFKHLQLKQIFQEVSLTKKFQFVDEEDLCKRFTSQILCQKLGFKVACEELSKIRFTSSPRQKIKFVQLAYTRLKSMIYEKSNKKHELLNMEDIIPVMILLVLLSNIDDLRTELDLMKNFVDLDLNDMQSQKRVIINLSESYNYIVRDWKIAQLCDYQG